MEPLKGTFNMPDNNEKPKNRPLPEAAMKITPEEWAEVQQNTEISEKMHDAWLEKKFAKYDEKQKKLKETEQGKIKPPEQG